jgi:hypothetical protein
MPLLELRFPEQHFRSNAHRFVVFISSLLKAEIKAPPVTASYSWTGIAFDYLLRFYVESFALSEARAPHY